MDYTAVGQTTHLAGRMEQMAMPGSILITPAVLGLVEGLVQVKALGAMPVRGLRDPVEVYEVTGAGMARSRLQAAAARGLTRFVGRTTELDQLRDALNRARVGHGQVVAVLGEPSVGKSRLFWEFTHDILIDLWNALEPLDWARMGKPLHEAEVLARALGDRHRLARIATFMGNQCWTTGDYDEAVRFGQEALSIARTLGERSIEVVATSFLGLTHVARGEFSDAAALLERNVVFEGDLRHERFGTPFIQSALSGAYLADVFSQLGRFDEAIEHADAAVRIAEAADHPLSLFTGLFYLGLAHLRRGDLPRVTRVLERGLDLCLAGDVASAGGGGDAEAHYRQALALAEGLGMRPLHAHCHRCLGALYARTGQQEQARAALSTAIELYRAMEMTFWLPQTEAVLAQVVGR
jgi:tetratricopeptide (TPR) repeat protein